jgi:hypothetical protein
MSCERYEESLTDVALGAAADAALATHLASCARCRARLEDERRLAGLVDATLAAALEVDPSSGFADGVRARIAGRPRRHAASRWVWAGSALAAAAALILWLASTRPPAPAPEIAGGAPSPAVAIPEAVPTQAAPPPAGAPPRTMAGDIVKTAVSPRRATTRPPVVPDVETAREALPMAEASAPPALPPLPQFQSPALEVQALDDLPRLTVTDGPPLELAKPLNSLITGGGV